MRDRNAVDLGVSGFDEEMGRVEKVKAIIRIYCIKKENMFNKKCVLKATKKQGIKNGISS